MKLSIKLALYIALIAIAGSGLVALNSYFIIQERSERTVDQTVTTLIRTMYQLAVSSVAEQDSMHASDVVLGLEYSEAIACAVVRSDSFSVGSASQCDNEEAIIRKLVSTVGETAVTGELVVYKSSAYVKQLAREQFHHEMRSLVTLIIIICVCLLIITHISVAKPIVNISRQISNINFDGDFELLQEGKRKDEIGNIGRVINLMLVNAEKQIINQKMLTHRTEELSRHFKLIFNLSKNYLAVTDGRLRLRSFNPKFEELLSYSAEPENIKNTDMWVACVSDDPDALRDLILSSKERNVPCSTQIEFTYHSDRLQQLFFQLTFVKNNVGDDGANILIFINDITDHKLKLQETEYEATHDNLTQLINRPAATRQIRHLLSARDYSQEVALMFLDLDGFKQVNDELGHDAGDIVLKKTARRIKSITRKTDIACRWGGDEFLIALSDVTEQDAIMMANKLLRRIAKPIDIDADTSRQVGVSIGLVMSSEHVSDFSTLFDHADQTMYEVKKSGKHGVRVYSHTAVNSITL